MARARSFIVERRSDRPPGRLIPGGLIDIGGADHYGVRRRSFQPNQAPAVWQKRRRTFVEKAGVTLGQRQ
jgi:hypothetical protein